MIEDLQSSQSDDVTERKRSKEKSQESHQEDDEEDRRESFKSKGKKKKKIKQCGYKKLRKHSAGHTTCFMNS
jgi:hypothetical protein